MNRREEKKRPAGKRAYSSCINTSPKADHYYLPGQGLSRLNTFLLCQNSRNIVSVRLACHNIRSLIMWFKCLSDRCLLSHRFSSWKSRDGGMAGFWCWLTCWLWQTPSAHNLPSAHLYGQRGLLLLSPSTLLNWGTTWMTSLNVNYLLKDQPPNTAPIQLGRAIPSITRDRYNLL